MVGFFSINHIPGSATAYCQNDHNETSLFYDQTEMLPVNEEALKARSRGYMYKGY
jgi:hypothetical protein